MDAAPPRGVAGGVRRLRSQSVWVGGALLAAHCGLVRLHAGGRDGDLEGVFNDGVDVVHELRGGAGGAAEAAGSARGAGGEGEEAEVVGLADWDVEEACGGLCDDQFREGGGLVGGQARAGGEGLVVRV